MIRKAQIHNIAKRDHVVVPDLREGNTTQILSSEFRAKPGSHPK